MSALLIAILTALAQIFGPMLLEWLRNLFTKAEKNVGSANDVGLNVVFDEAIRLARGKPFRRALLRAIKPNAVKLAAGGKLSAGDRAELVALASKAKGE